MGVTTSELTLTVTVSKLSINLLKVGNTVYICLYRLCVWYWNLLQLVHYKVICHELDRLAINLAFCISVCVYSTFPARGPWSHHHHSKPVQDSAAICHQGNQHLQQHMSTATQVHPPCMQLEFFYKFNHASTGKEFTMHAVSLHLDSCRNIRYYYLD